MRAIPAVAAALLLFSCAAGAQKSSPPANEPVQFRATAKPLTTSVQSQLREEFEMLMPRIAALVAGLGSSDYKARERAKKGLEEIGLPAVPALEEAAKSRDPQVSHAAAALAGSLKPGTSRIIPSDPAAIDRLGKKTLEGPESQAAPARGRLAEFVEFLRTKTGLSVVVHPSIARANPMVEIDRKPGLLTEYLKLIAHSLDAAWVQRFEVFYLAPPHVALEMAGAEVLSASNEKEKDSLRKLGLQRVTISTNRESTLGNITSFFTEIQKVEFVFGKGVNPREVVPDFEVRDLRLRNMIALVLFSLSLRADFDNDRFTLSKADYSQFSGDLRKKQNLLKKYRNLWGKSRKISE